MPRRAAWLAAAMLAQMGTAHAATTAFNKLPDYEKFGITVTSAYHVRQCGVTVTINQSRFIDSASALENEGILDNVTPAIISRQPAYYIGQAMHEIVPTIIYHTFLRYTDAVSCHFVFHAKGGSGGGEDEALYGIEESAAPAFLSFVVNSHTHTQVDWYKASFDEIREVASKFEEDPAYAAPLTPEEGGTTQPAPAPADPDGIQDVTDRLQ
ncbi:hypothetical protein [Komagataeibacter swingsii]|uniref:Uncharacterized protein n=1 Tax=Komagataeibacter swingsii TaxID=215220 RepID=A0A850P0X0_9PROT|nr:hypothetical protein [Komagataeibacter swingsii]NVN37194.1 hypothetical protein [Komagataeibacter swingsii]RFP05702.1 hypothetical protein BFX83_16470 [Komagataeibacter xylinus]RFP06104.1 hypothetical protein BGC31_15115 [Komagataeibacter xylinus]